MKKHIEFILIIVIFGIISNLIICNIKHMTYLNKDYIYNFKDCIEINNINKSINNIESNISKMYNLNHPYISDGELETIKNNLNTVIEITKSYEFLKYNDSNHKMNQVELSKMIHDTQKIGVLTSIEIYKILSLYDLSLDFDKFINYSTMQLLSNNNIDMLLFNNYRYTISNANIKYSDMSIKTIINTLSMKLYTLEYVSNLVIESGEVNDVFN